MRPAHVPRLVSKPRASRYTHDNVLVSPIEGNNVKTHLSSQWNEASLLRNVPRRFIVQRQCVISNRTTRQFWLFWVRLQEMLILVIHNKLILDHYNAHNTRITQVLVCDTDRIPPYMFKVMNSQWHAMSSINNSFAHHYRQSPSLLAAPEVKKRLSPLHHGRPKCLDQDFPNGSSWREKGCQHRQLVENVVFEAVPVGVSFKPLVPTTTHERAIEKILWWCLQEERKFELGKHLLHFVFVNQNGGSRFGCLFETQGRRV